MLMTSFVLLLLLRWMGVGIRSLHCWCGSDLVWLDPHSLPPQYPHVYVLAHIIVDILGLSVSTRLFTEGELDN